MEQLPLEVRFPDFAVFDSFFVGGNGDLLHALREAAVNRTRLVAWVWGPPGSGRSHLLQACVNLAAESGYRAAYLPFGKDHAAPAAALDGMGQLDVLCLDDVDQMAGNAEWERAMFVVYETIVSRGARLIVSANRPPLHADFNLPDLASRFAAAATFRIRGLDDGEKVKAMQQRAQWRGLELPDDAAHFLMTRVDRDLTGLFALLDQLDHAALARQRRLTIPFIRSVLGS